jgi:hypothetical protein
VRDDVEQGYLSPATAAAVYGLGARADGG